MSSVAGPSTGGRFEGGSVEVLGMRRFLFAILAFGLIASPAAARGQQGPNAPRAALIATTEERLDWQSSKLIFSTWDGEEYDNSFPPVRWPRPMRTAATELTVTIHTPLPPESVGVRLWKELRPNGIPKGKGLDMQCYVDAPPGECTLRPSVSTDGVAWSVVFEPPWRGRTYIATAAEWADAQVAWINHVVLK